MAAVHAWEQPFGSGTTALWAALRGLGCSGAYVAVPAAVCPSVVAAVLASGNLPWFVDIEETRLGMCPRALAAIAGELGAVVAVHGYGIPCLIEETRAVCARHGLPLIEDCAQAEGAELGGVEVGSFGDVAVFSYGAGKILDAGGGGRACGRDPRVGAEVARLHETLPAEPDPHAASDLGRIYKFFYNLGYPDRIAPYRFVFARLLDGCGARMLSRASAVQAPRIRALRDDLPHQIARRRAKADLYRRRLGDLLELAPEPEGSVPWRFNVLLPPATRDDVLRTLLAKGWRVSSWYPDITPYFDDPRFRSTDVARARRLSSRVLNLWLDDATNEAYVEQSCSEVLALIDRPRRET